MSSVSAAWLSDLPPEVLDVVKRAAALPRGLAHLHHAPIEYVSIRLGVHPAVLERVRAALENPAIRAEAIFAFVRATEANAAPPQAAPQPEGRAAPRDVQEILDEVHASATAREFLLSTHPEVVAVALGIHPDLVLAARATLGVGGAVSEELA